MQAPEHCPPVDALILDGAVIVQMLVPKQVNTFDEYFENIFKPYILKQLQTVVRLDVIWDVYRQDSLKGATRENSGTGIRRRVKLTTHIPGNWQSFLRVNENKTELFHLLAEQVTSIKMDGKEIYCTLEDQVLSSPNFTQDDKVRIEPCTHEEADTRIMLHVADAAEHGFKKIMVRTVDTDVVVILISHIQDILAQEVWIAFGIGKNCRFISAHEIATKLGTSKSKALLMFHAITGCDMVSFFSGRGKKTAWNTWDAFPQVTDAFAILSKTPFEISTAIMDVVQRFVVIWYDRTSELSKVNESRQQLFSKGKPIENIPPTEEALKQHVKRAAYIAGYVCRICITGKRPENPKPS